MRAVVWNTRSALLYSIGGWTVLGGMLHYTYKTSGGAEGSGVHENETNDKANEELTRKTVVANMPIGLQITTVTTYHKELPPLTRLLRRMAAFFTSSSSAPPSEN